MTLDNGQKATVNSPEKENYQISLLEEKLQLTRRQQKIGEVIIRKEVDTKIVSIPIRREKLVVQRVGKNPQQLAEITLSEETINGLNYDEIDGSENIESRKSHFISLAAAQELLTAIDRLNLTGSTTIRLEIVNNSTEDQAKLKAVSDHFQLQTFSASVNHN